MYGKPIGPGAAAPPLAVTGFYTGSALLLALVLLIVGGVLVRMSYLKRTAANDK